MWVCMDIYFFEKVGILIVYSYIFVEKNQYKSNRVWIYIIVGKFSIYLIMYGYFC